MNGEERTSEYKTLLRFIYQVPKKTLHFRLTPVPEGVELNIWYQMKGCGGFTFFRPRRRKAPSAGEKRAQQHSGLALVPEGVGVQNRCQMKDS